ncbi:hypothetical protein B0T25DRAFT_31264 [Lasiosphaeria hispida]|uniref:Uncharacterized protein n=1 Tax=Lasiosphaeria hispida TaxID=260671 RepID=A0AAJ0MK24_9PEZI|nr:hypothetical protein B0T25DRAFT_31264 [Lasiosphaeria hispida]
MRIPISIRIPVPVPVVDLSIADKVLGSATSRLRPRDDRKPAGKTSLIVVAVVVGVLALIAAIIVLRSFRSRHPNPKYIPTPFLKRLWADWKVPGHSRGAYRPTGNSEDSTRLNNRTQQEGAAEALAAARIAGTGAAAGATTAAGVDRNVSVRSVMTLPVYRPRPGENEQVLGREGERDGIDVVVEMPTAEVEEAMREEEMDALYQIRAARRRQISEREERRRLRREARDTNNTSVLQDLRDQARGQAGRNLDEINELRQEHERIRDSRQRTVSSVSYAEVGIARADGTRIRANSTESERIGLLSDAASIGQSVAAASLESGAASLFHRRERSASSLSIDTSRSNERPESPGLATAGSQFSLASVGRSRTNSGVGSGLNTPRFSITTPRAGSSPEIIDAEDGDLGDSSMPPPGYDEVSLSEITPANSGRNSAMSGRGSPYNEPPPEYPGPSQIRNNRLSAHMEDLAIHVLPEDNSQRRSSRSSGSIPQLPSLRLNRLPQIVIDPSSARP